MSWRLSVRSILFWAKLTGKIVVQEISEDRFKGEAMRLLTYSYRKIRGLRREFQDN